MEAGGSHVVGVSEPEVGIGALHGAVDGDAPVLAGGAGGAAEEAEEDVGEDLGIRGRELGAVAHVHFGQRTGRADASRRLEDHGFGHVGILRKLPGVGADHGLPAIEVPLVELHVAGVDVLAAGQRAGDGGGAVVERFGVALLEGFKGKLGADGLAERFLLGQSRAEDGITGGDGWLIQEERGAEVERAVEELGERQGAAGSPIEDAELLGPTGAFRGNADAVDAIGGHGGVIVAGKVLEFVFRFVVAAGLILLAAGGGRGR